MTEHTYGRRPDGKPATHTLGVLRDGDVVGLDVDERGRVRLTTNLTDERAANLLVRLATTLRKDTP